VRTRTAVPTREESLALVRNLLRTAISSIVYLRNIFPEHCFRDRTLTGLYILFPISLLFFNDVYVMY